VSELSGVPHNCAKQVTTQETMTSGTHNGTSFPHPASQGSSWNMTLVHEIAKAIGKEAY
jgi:beta-glucosidase-like glycosyl hydrolase